MASKKTSTAKTLNKSDFIRLQPATLSATQVVAKGKAAGIKFSTQLVYNVRGGSKAKKGAAKKTTTAQPSAAPSKADPRSKADFVRSRSHLSPREIVEDAKTAGLQLNVKYVYNWRRAANGTKKKNRVVTQTTTSKATLTGGVRSPASSSAETLLRAVAAEIGLGRAIELLQGERARVQSILRG